MSANVSLKAAATHYFRYKETMKNYLFRLLFQSKNGGSKPKNLTFCHKLEMLMEIFQNQVHTFS